MFRYCTFCSTANRDRQTDRRGRASPVPQHFPPRLGAGPGARVWRAGRPMIPAAAMSRQSTLLRFFSKAPPAPPTPAEPRTESRTEPRTEPPRRRASGERNGLQAAGSPPGGAGRAAARRGENGEKGAGGGAAAKGPRYRRGRGGRGARCRAGEGRGGGTGLQPLAVGAGPSGCPSCRRPVAAAVPPVPWMWCPRGRPASGLCSRRAWAGGTTGHLRGRGRAVGICCSGVVVHSWFRFALWAVS